MSHVSPAVNTPPSLNRYLLPHERSCIAVRMHPAALARPLILASSGLVAARKLTGRSVRPEFVWGAYLPVLLYFLHQVAAWRVTYFTVTDKRMMVIRGLLLRTVAAVPLNKVTDLEFQCTPLGRLLGYGTLIVTSSDSCQAFREVRCLRHPEQLYLEVSRLIFSDTVAETQQDEDPSPD